MLRNIAMSLLLLLGLSACAGNTDHYGQTFNSGAATVGTIGAIAGSQLTPDKPLLGAALGALAGIVLGNQTFDAPQAAQARAWQEQQGQGGGYGYGYPPNYGYQPQYGYGGGYGQQVWGHDGMCPPGFQASATYYQQYGHPTDCRN